MRGGAHRPVDSGNEIKMTGARSARARTRGQNPLVFNILQGAVYALYHGALDTLCGAYACSVMVIGYDYKRYGFIKSKCSS